MNPHWLAAFSLYPAAAVEELKVEGTLPEGGEARQPRHHVVFLENLLEELRRRVPMQNR